MTSTMRAALLAFLCAGALSTTGLAAAELSAGASEDGAPLSADAAWFASPAELRGRGPHPGEGITAAGSHDLEDVLERELRRVARRVAALDRRAAAKRARAGVHPVAGSAADYGESGARFGALRSGHVHEGQDVFAPAGTPLRAVVDGVVVETGNDGGRGNYVAIFSAVTRRTYVYLHMQAPSEASRGATVRAGERIGRVGCTGSCWGDHLHFEVREGRGTGAPPVDPMPHLERWARPG